MRIWETRFRIINPLPSLPTPFDAVLEVQEFPLYRMEGAKRQGSTEGQLVCTIKGEGCFSLKGRTAKLVPGKAFLASISDADTAYFYPERGKEPWVFLWLSFRGESGMSILKDINNVHGYLFDLPLDKGPVKYMESFRKFRGTVQSIDAIAGAKIVMDLFAELGSLVEAEKHGDPSIELVKEGQRMISLEAESDIKVATLAKRLNVSREHLSRIFHSRTGGSPAQFLAQERMHLAERLLNDRRLSCKEIAERLGYDSQSSFARAYKAYHNATPSSRHA